MITNNVYVGNGHADFECQDALLDILIDPIWGPTNREEAMKMAVEGLASNFVLLNNGKPFTSGWWYIGYFKSDRIYSRYHENENRFEIFRVGDSML